MISCKTLINVLENGDKVAVVKNVLRKAFLVINIYVQVPPNNNNKVFNFIRARICLKYFQATGQKLLVNCYDETIPNATFTDIVGWGWIFLGSQEEMLPKLIFTQMLLERNSMSGKTVVTDGALYTTANTC